MVKYSSYQVDVIISDFVLFPTVSVPLVLAQLYQMAECHRKFCIRAHGCVTRSCLLIVCVPLIPPHLAKHPKAKFDVIMPLGYISHYEWFNELIGGIRVLNTTYNNGRMGFSS